MSNLVCLRHKEYKGISAPVLSCTTCCSIYIESLKENREHGKVENDKKADKTKSWVDQKRKEAVSSFKEKSIFLPKGFDPSAI